jgi:hypothetical protein
MVQNVFVRIVLGATVCKEKLAMKFANISKKLN